MSAFVGSSFSGEEASVERSRILFCPIEGAGDPDQSRRTRRYSCRKNSDLAADLISIIQRSEIVVVHLAHAAAADAALAALARGRNLCCSLNRFVQIFAIENVIPCELSLVSVRLFVIIDLPSHAAAVEAAAEPARPPLTLALFALPPASPAGEPL